MFPIDKWASIQPNKIFLYDEIQTYSFQEFQNSVNNLSSCLFQNAFPIQKVVLLSEQTAEVLKFLCAIWRLNGCVLPLSTKITEFELQRVVSLYQPTILLSDKPISVKFKTKVQVVLIEELFITIQSADLPDFTLDQSMNDACLIIASSGSTDQPKLIKHNWNRLHKHAALSQTYLQLIEEDCWLLSLPLHHIGGIVSLFKSFYTGLSLANGLPFSVNETLQQLQQFPVTRLSLVPTMLQSLFEQNDAPFSQQVTSILLGGGAIPSDLVTRDSRILATYGLSEAGSQVTTVPLSTDDRNIRDSCGFPLPEVSVEIRDANGKTIPHGTEGEIWVLTPTRFLGYDGECQDIAEPNEWIDTGDLGYLDVNGALWVTNRRTDLIVTGGKNVNVREVENIIRQHPKVKDAVAVPVPSKKWGQLVCAAVVLKGKQDVTESELQLYLKQTLSAYKIPKQWIFLDSLPVLEHGKIDRLGVIQLFSSLD